MVVELIQAEEITMDGNNYDRVNFALASEPQGGATLHYFMNIGVSIKWATGMFLPLHW